MSIVFWFKGVITFQIKGSYTRLQVLSVGVITFQIKGSYTYCPRLSLYSSGVITFKIKGSYTFNTRSEERKVWAASKGNKQT